MCPHGYRHSGSMATPALGTWDVLIYVLMNVGCTWYTCKFENVPAISKQAIYQFDAFQR